MCGIAGISLIKDRKFNNEELLKFEALATEWWDHEGKFKPLHMLNPCRLDFITEHLSLYLSKDFLAYQSFLA